MLNLTILKGSIVLTKQQPIVYKFTYTFTHDCILRNATEWLILAILHIFETFLTPIYVYICMVFITDGFFEVAIESWPEWDLNPRPLNSVQTL